MITARIAIILSILSAPSALAADIAALVPSQAGEVNSVNQRFNQKTREVAKEYGRALEDHLLKGSPYPYGMTEKFAAVEKQRVKELEGVEARQEQDRNLVRKTQAKEIVNKLLGPARMQQLTQGTPGDGKGVDPKGGDKKTAAAGGEPAVKPETVLDGSGLSKEVEFGGKKKTSFSYDPNDPKSYGH